MLGSEYKKSGLRISMLEISWVASRVIVLVILQFGLETLYKVGWFEFLGPQEIQRLVFDVLKKALLTLYLWLFLSIFKKFVLPLIIKLFTPVVDKVVTDPKTKGKHVAMVSRYFMYVAYVVAVLAFVNIWVYSYVGVWLAGTLGTGVAVALTFVLVGDKQRHGVRGGGQGPDRGLLRRCNGRRGLLHQDKDDQG